MKVYLYIVLWHCFGKQYANRLFFQDTPNRVFEESMTPAKIGLLVGSFVCLFVLEVVCLFIIVTPISWWFAQVLIALMFLVVMIMDDQNRNGFEENAPPWPYAFALRYTFFFVSVWMAQRFVVHMQLTGVSLPVFEEIVGCFAPIFIGVFVPIIVLIAEDLLYKLLRWIGVMLWDNIFGPLVTLVIVTILGGVKKETEE